MSELGTASTPLRIAIIGSGPAGFYAAEYLLKQKELTIEVDMFDRLPTPFGLVRGGVAPDHQKIKGVTKIYERVASNPAFHFFGYVEVGKDLSIDDLKAHYHQIIFATGAQTDKPLNIPGIELKNSHAATEFVAWYNGHPDYRHLEFDLSQESVVVIGVGNVAVDVARILCRTPEELATTDIADYALDALRESKVKDVYLLGRRGPLQAAFTAPEVKELGEMDDADAVVLAHEAELDALSSAEFAETTDRATKRKLEYIQSYAGRELTGKSRRIHMRFLQSPVELLGDEAGAARSMRLVRNELVSREGRGLRAKATEDFEEIPAGLVFRSIGYRGVPIEGVPFRDDWGTIPNELGRVVVEADSAETQLGLYTTGWIKRGPSGVIGTNKADSVETAKQMLEDIAAEKTLAPQSATLEAIQALVAERQPQFVTYADWQKLDALEVAAGEAQGRPRVKFTSIDEMLDALSSD